MTDFDIDPIWCARCTLPWTQTTSHQRPIRVGKIQTNLLPDGEFVFVCRVLSGCESENLGITVCHSKTFLDHWFHSLADFARFLQGNVGRLTFEVGIEFTLFDSESNELKSQLKAI